MNWLYFCSRSTCQHVDPAKLFLSLIFVVFSFSFQLPEFLSQLKEALGLPLSPPVQASPVAGPSSAPPVPVPVLSSVPPPIVLENSDSENDVQTLAVPFRSASSEAYLPMISNGCRIQVLLY